MERREEKNLQTNIAIILTKVEYIEAEIKAIKEKLEKDYVTRDEFEPISKGFYSLVGLILLSMIGAIINFFIKFK